MAYTKAQINKIGNLLVYITSKLGSTPKMKLLKLVYVIEEEYVKKAGVKLTELSFTHLPMGPVSTFIDNQIKKKRDPLMQFISVRQQDSSTIIDPVVSFNDDEFSEFDLKIIDDVIKRFGSATGGQLSEYTHREGSLWKKINDQYEGSPPAQTHIDFEQLLDDESIDSGLRQAAKEGKAFIDYLFDIS